MGERAASRLRILHVTPFYEPAWAYGGMARCSAALCAALARRGHEITVVTARLAPEHAPDERSDGVRVIRLPGPAFLARRLVPWGRGLRSLLDRLIPSIDVAHLHGHRNGLAVVAGRALVRARAPWVLLCNGTYPHHGQRRWAKLLFDRAFGDAVVSGARALVAVSQAEARDLPRAARVIPNGVAEPAVEANVAREGQRMLFVGTDRPQKRAGRLADLLAAVPEARLTLIGRFAPAFRERFAACGPRVEFAGVVPAPSMGTALARAALLVHPAVGEAFGLAPFEAALCGTPAVVAGGHGCGEWFGRAGGCVVPPDDEAALADAVRKRLADPRLGAAEARAVAEYARRELTWDGAAARVESLYHEVLDSGAGASR
jgi:glycosyltransferase involved in cell wall biosynthesis